MEMRDLFSAEKRDFSPDIHRDRNDIILSLLQISVNWNKVISGSLWHSIKPEFFHSGFYPFPLLYRALYLR